MFHCIDICSKIKHKISIMDKTTETRECSYCTLCRYKIQLNTVLFYFKKGAGKMNTNIKKEFYRLLKFNIIGLMNTAIDFLVFSILTGLFILPLILAQVLSYSCGIINSYVWNRYWTFKAKGKRNTKEFTKFFAINLVMLIISTVMIYHLVEVVTNVYVAKLLVITVVMILNFFAQRIIIFNETEPKI